MSHIDDPRQIGGTITVANSTELAELDVSRLTIGTKILNAGVGFYFALRVSTASLDPDVVVAVKDHVGSRWLLDTSDSDVASVTGSAPIVINNADPNNPIVTLPSGVVTSVSAGTGISVTGTAAVPVINVSGGSTLAAIYTAGLGVPASNTLDGSYFETFFNDEATMQVKQAPSTSGGDFDAHPGVIVQRNFTTQGVDGMVASWRQKYSGGTNLNGGVQWRYGLVSDSDVLREFGTFQAFTVSTSNPAYYSPTLDADYRFDSTFVRHTILNRRGTGAVSQIYNNSDGVEWRMAMFPSTTGPYTLVVDQLSMQGVAAGGGGGAAEPQTGSKAQFLVTGPAASPDDGVAVAGYQVELVDKNFGSAQAAGRIDLIASTLTGGKKVVGSFQDTRRATVDIISAEQDFETATSFTVVPIATGVNAAPGTRFMPVHAFVELTSVDTLAVGPTVELGNNAGEDNVAPALAVANTNVTDSLIPFVMSATPSIITLGTTAITGHCTVNATATTCLGRIHIIGVYV